jgi:predicted aldo/keto reductase-like oxidoreductase
MGAEGALRAVLSAQEQGMTRFVGVTGHGVDAAAMHMKSLERHPFDSVLLPWNYPLAQNSEYASTFAALLDTCSARGIAVQIIKSVAHGGPLAGATRRYNTWYRPLEDQYSLDRAVHWVMGLEDVFVVTPGDLDLLPMVLAAGASFRAAPADSEMAQMALEQKMWPLFT